MEGLGRGHVRYALTLLEAGANPLQLVDVKKHLRQESADDDDLIQAYMDAAQSLMDGRDGILGRALLTQQWVMKRERFSWYPFPYSAAPYDYTWLSRDWAWDPWAWRDAFGIRIPLPPLQSIDSVQYMESADSLETLTTLDPSQYKVVDGGGGESWILPASGTTWPATAIEPDAVQITFTCGYTDVASLAKERVGIVQAMKLLIGLWYKEREASLIGARAAEVDLPWGIMALLQPHRLHIV